MAAQSETTACTFPGLNSKRANIYFVDAKEIIQSVPLNLAAFSEQQQQRVNRDVWLQRQPRSGWGHQWTIYIISLLVETDTSNAAPPCAWPSRTWICLSRRRLLLSARWPAQTSRSLPATWRGAGALPPSPLWSRTLHSRSATYPASQVHSQNECVI